MGLLDQATTSTTRSRDDRARVGVLALQGAFHAHVKMLALCGVSASEVRTPSDLSQVDALVMPGGESTTMSKLLVSSGLFSPLADRISSGLPVFGTCAGMILLARGVLDGRPDQLSFGAIDITVRRNGYGRQIDSFETDLDVTGLDQQFHGVFIRAPKVEHWADDVEVLASYDDTPVLLRQRRVSVASFHPELASDPRLHELFIGNLQQ